MSAPYSGSNAELHAEQRPLRRREDSEIRELLEALKAVLETCAHDEPTECPACSKAYAAVKKAEARQ